MATKNIFKPILFNTEMVQAILAGRKTQTRRIIKSRHESGIFQVCKNFDGKVTSIESLDWDERNCEKDILSKYQIDDILWVRETYGSILSLDEFCYKADVCSPDVDKPYLGWKPSIYMPKEAARIFLKVTNVRCERLQDISREDCKNEGIKFNESNYPRLKYYFNYITKSFQQPSYGRISPSYSFQTLWDSINAKKHPWESNPWVWVYDFEVIDKPEDFN